MAIQFEYKYAIIMENGLCIEKRDSTNFVLNRLYVPIEDDSLPYLMKYYYPIPETVTSFDDFQGKWYADAAHTIEVPELNA